MKWIKRLLLLNLILALMAGGVAGGMGYQRYQEAIEEVPLEQKIESVRQREDYTPYEQISADFIHAIVAVEDHRFFSRKGIDFISIGRALITNLFAGELKEGGSTITQQLAKNLYFDNRPSLTRKIAEIFFLYDLERNYTKEEILSYYVNVIYFGDGYYGVTAASRGYFNKEPSALTLAEASLMAGLPQSPSRYQLSDGLDLARNRQKQVLEAMKASGYVDETTAQQALEWSAGYPQKE